MKTFIQLFVLFIFCFTPQLYSSDVGLRVFYGDDDRIEADEFNYSPHFESLRSIAAMVDDEYLIRDRDKNKLFMNYWVGTIKYDFLLCDGVRFEDQPSLASCTGFLVDDDILVTAGHCMKNSKHSLKDKCRDFTWIFDYKLADRKKPFNISFPEENVYKCAEVLQIHYSPNVKTPTGTKIAEDSLDYAVIKLDRKVSGRFPLKLNNNRKVKDDVPLFVAGYPWGLPLKVTANANVLDNSKQLFFTTNLDTFGANSGSPVFNEITGIVEGILVRGKPDLYLSKDDKCHRINRCLQDGKDCIVNHGLSGEHVMRIEKVVW